MAPDIHQPTGLVWDKLMMQDKAVVQKFIESPVWNELLKLPAVKCIGETTIDNTLNNLGRRSGLLKLKKKQKDINYVFEGTKKLVLYKRELIRQYRIREEDLLWREVKKSMALLDIAKKEERRRRAEKLRKEGVSLSLSHHHKQLWRWIRRLTKPA